MDIKETIKNTVINTGNYNNCIIDDSNNDYYLITATKGKQKDIVYIPKDLDFSAQVSYIPESNFKDYSVDRYLNSDGKLDCIVSITSSVADERNSAGLTYEIAKALGSPVSSALIEGASKGGTGALVTADRYSANYSSEGVEIRVALADPTISYSDYKDMDGSIQNLIDNNVPIIIAAGKNFTGTNQFTNFLTKTGTTGLNLCKFTITDENGKAITNHNEILAAFKSGKYGLYLTGLLDGEYGNIEFTGTYDYETGTFITPEGSSIETLGINFNLLSSGIDSLQGALNGTYLNNLVYDGISTTTIPKNMYQVQNSVLGISAKLDGLLGYDMTLLTNVMGVMQQMGIDLENKALSLNDLCNAETTSKFNEYGEYLLSNQIDASYFTLDTSILEDSPLATIGTTGKISMSDISKIFANGKLCGDLGEMFTLENQNAEMLRTGVLDLQSILSNSGLFQGEIWTAVNNKLDIYKELMTLRINVNLYLESAYIKALELIANYMSPDDELDDAEIPELEQKISELEKEIAYNQEIISAVETKVDENGNTYRDYVYSETTRNQAVKVINNAVLAKKEIQERIEKIEGLPEIMNKANKIIEDATRYIYDNYMQAVNNITTGKTTTYVSV